MSDHTCSTCHKGGAQFRCVHCKRDTFCGEQCYENHPDHELLCWDRSSQDPHYVGAVLEHVLPLMEDEEHRFTEEQFGIAYELLDDLQSGNPEFVDMAHECIEDIL